ncbi:unnamed protein product [Cuscuta campestris]|uniref:Uncharacterized protein n=1 Tax=Cuscuta campestris TaxID=132261 RepID=A0A484K5K0_9ASTE|nr:unnamed protein product [Cuscuta campestris]
MGFLLRVRIGSFVAGAAVASAVGLYILHKDYKMAHHALSTQMNAVYQSLNGRVLALEKMKAVEATKQAESAN